MAKIRNTEIFKQDVKKLYFDNILVIGEFINMKTKIKMKCMIHDKCFDKEPDKLLNRNQHCPECGKERIASSRRKSQESFEQKFYQYRNRNEYKLLSKYKGDRKEVKVLHYVCENEFTTTPLSVWASNGCPICNDRRKSTEEFKREVCELECNEYEVLGDYSNCYTHIEMKHKKCGHEWKLIPNSFLQGSRCPKCNESKGEKLISDFLKNKHIHHIIQVKYNNCKNKAMLSYDTGVIDDGTLSLLIEFDGQQHFYPVGCFGGEKKFINQLKNDKIKNQYCIDNNIPLLRIPYWKQKNIEIILESALMYYNIIPKTDSYDYSLIAEWIVDSEWDHDEYIAKCPKNKKDFVNNSTLVNY